MPKPNKTMTQRECEICERVLYLRKKVLKWSQPVLAMELGITQNQLASIEYKRVPLRMEIARLLCENFDISQRWLALGVLPIHPRYDAYMGDSVSVNKNSLFSWFFDKYLSHETGLVERSIIRATDEAAFRKGTFVEHLLADPAKLKMLNPEAIAFFTKIAINLYINDLPARLKISYSKALMHATDEFLNKYVKQRAGTVTAPSKEPPKKPVDIFSNKENIEGVKRYLPELIKRLKNVTSERGKKAALADFLDVTPAMVSQWLSGDREPGGETTLRLLTWIEQEERQK